MPIQSSVKRNYGPSGLATVRLLKNSVKIVFEDGEIYELPLEEWPESTPAGSYIVGLNSDETRVSFIKPPAGQYLVRFKEMNRKGSDTPEPWIQRGGLRRKKDGGTFYAKDELKFTAVLEVLDPDKDSKYNSMTIVYAIPYLFQETPGSQEAQLKGWPSRLKVLEEFLQVFGLNFLNDSIPYSPNVLPYLENLLQEKDAVAMATIGEKGFVDSVSSVPDYLIPPELKKK